MFDYSDSGVTLTTVLDTRRDTKEGLYPVKVRVTYRRIQKYYSTGKTMSLVDWEKLPVTKSKTWIGIRNEIQLTTDRVKDQVKDLIKQDNFSFDNLNNRLGKGLSNTLNTVFIAKIEELQKSGKVGTADWYRYTLRSIILFERSDIDLKLFKGEKFKDTAMSGANRVSFAQITPTWLKRYENHLLGLGKSYTTISIYIRALQVVINYAKSTGFIKASQYPFGKGKYEIPQPEGRNIALTIADIGKIVKYECETDTVSMCRDLWFFSYLCNGANITDICKLRYSNIRNGEICFYRQKTVAKAKRKKLICAFITPEMQEVIAKWGNKSRAPEDFIFPFLKGNETPTDERRIIKNITHLMNYRMKAIGEKLGIGHITTYTARHSYASVLKRSGANIAFISESLGHNDLKTTENYLASFEQEERVKNAALLTNF
ncbi:site-specific recombinase XerD [Pontibacter ummariensis]|uniref:Site-specific recombinase XerD n=1 Tax=Pontibacter ummariensis TaxID=1610492 RepID=A0A239IZC6_9BACT|nr:site-specific integrase [Pontibacter ummariensis]PRY09040.1 site-specific recombinase XerD [Pontibacter ummariensis]SNS98940.1 Site-specific recombinase XerD [Pontibacter ummariensis]